MISYTHLLVLVPCFFTLMFMHRWWTCIQRLGFSREVSQRAPALVQSDLLAAALALMPFVIAIVDWSGLTLPQQAAPVSSGWAVLTSIACFIGAMVCLRNSGGRLAGHWAGTRESALRTVAALRIIDAAELQYALNFAQQHEANQRAERVIEGKVLEVRK